jgi:hypothetical protein
MVISRSLITVARPHGIFTRFPILPNLLGHPDAFNYKEQFVIDADTITLGFTVSIPATRQVICGDRGRLARKRSEEGAESLRSNPQFIFALRAHCGRDAPEPSNHFTSPFASAIGLQ